MALFKKTKKGNMVLLVDDDDRVYSFALSHLIDYLQQDKNYEFFFGARLATEDGFLTDGRFDPSHVYFLDRQETMELDEAIDYLGDEVVEDALATKEQQQKKRDKREKYSELDW